MRTTSYCPAVNWSRLPGHRTRSRPRALHLRVGITHGSCLRHRWPSMLPSYRRCKSAPTIRDYRVIGAGTRSSSESSSERRGTSVGRRCPVCLLTGGRFCSSVQPEKGPGNVTHDLHFLDRLGLVLGAEPVGHKDATVRQTILPAMLAVWNMSSYLSTKNPTPRPALARKAAAGTRLAAAPPRGEAR